MTDTIISTKQYELLAADERFVPAELDAVEIIKCEACFKTECNTGRTTCRHCGNPLGNSFALVGALGEEAFFVRRSKVINVEQ